MPTSEILDFEALLKPIAADKPAGESLRYDGVYDAIQDARREEDALPMGDWEREVNWHWNAVISLAMGYFGQEKQRLADRCVVGRGAGKKVWL